LKIGFNNLWRAKTNKRFGGITVKYDSFKQLEKDYSVLDEEGKHQEALTLLEKGVESLPKDVFQKHLFTLIFQKAKLYSNCKVYEECLAALTYLIEEGFTCPLHWSGFEPLGGDLRFLKLEEKNELLRARDQEKAGFQYNIDLPEGYAKEKKYPVFFNLHGDGDNMELHSQYWKSDALLRKGFIVVNIQASQVTYHNAYAWLKRVFNVKGSGEWKELEYIYPLSENSYLIKACYNSAYDEIKACYELVLQQYSIDTKCIIIGGFSGGATAAIDITMANIIPIKGFISLCSQKPKSFTKKNIEIANQRGIKGVFMEGEDDTPVQEVEEMIKMLKELGVPYQYNINKGIGHWYPEDLDDKLEQALNFILR
jgi:predicted esterase